MALVGDLSYRPVYEKMVKDMLELRAEGVPIVDLGDIFQSRTESIYADRIHCQSGERKATDQFEPSPGYQIMAEAMARQLSELWKIPPKAGEAPR